MLYLGLMICSMLSIQNLSLDFYPQIESRKILIETEYIGSDAETVRELITIPIENACLAIQDRKDITSISKDGLSLVQIEFHFGTDMDVALLKTKEIIDSASELLPYGCKKSSVQLVDGSKKYFLFSITDDKDNLIKNRFFAEDTLRQELLRTKGVSEVSIIGGEEEEIQIIVDGSNLFHHSLNLRDVASSYNLTNFEFPIGSINEGENTYQIKMISRLKSEKQIGEIPVSHNIESGSVKIKDLGAIQKGIKDRKSFVLMNGKERVLVSVKYGAGANPIKVSKDIKKLLQNINVGQKNEYHFDILEDPTNELKKDLNDMLCQSAAGITITFIFLLLCFKSFVLALSVIISIPVCIILTLASLNLTGNTLNQISISGLTLGIGLIVDCSVIVVERLVYSSKISVWGNNVISSNCGSTATTIISFSPVLMIEGPIKEMFSSLSIAVISCVFFSFMVSFTLTVALIKLMDYKKTNVCYDKNYHKLVELCQSFLAHSTKTPVFSIVMVLFPIIFGFILIKFQNFKLDGNDRSEKLTMLMEFPDNISTEYLYKTGKELNNLFKEGKFMNKAVIKYDGNPSNSEITLNSLNSRYLEIILYTKKMNRHKLLKKFEELFDGPEFSIDLSANDTILKSLNGSLGRYVLFEENPNQLRNKSAQLKSLYECRLQPDEQSEIIEFKPNFEMFTKTGLSSEYVSSLVYDYFSGIDLNPMEIDSIKIPVRAIVKKENLELEEFINTIYLQTEQTHIPLISLGTLEKVKKDRIYYRENKMDAKILNPLSDDDCMFPEEFEILDRDKKQKSYLVREFLVLIFFISILIYIFLGILFNSFSLPLLVCVSMVLSIPGSLISLLMFKYCFDLNALIALVVLMGLSANNSIILIEAIKGKDFISKDEIIYSCSNRISSLLITNGTTILSLLPFIFHSTISISIIGGLIYSLVINIILIPSMLIMKKSDIKK